MSSLPRQSTRDSSRRSGSPIRAVPDAVSSARIELRQLRYLVTLAEELHFGRAAAREHIVPSALSAQVQRLERAVGVLLVDRTTRHVALTPAGARFLIEARQILEHVDRAAFLAQGMALAAPTLRVGVLDEGYDAVRPVLRAVQARHPELEIHQVLAGVPEQCRLLADGRLDVGIGRLPGTAPEIAAEMFRLDPLGVLIPDEHPLARLPHIPVSALRDETLLLADEEQAPEFNAFVAEVCRSAGFFPKLFSGSVQTLRAAVDLVVQGRCVLCTSASTAGISHGTDLTWRPLGPSVPRYPWSILWRAQDPSRYAVALVHTARELSAERGWREAAGERAS
ncbi:LysR substrate-binding domain-containing protein [Actinoplanes friuliensis]|uniref:LysR family transcriptional regulator n=1 Tax=Actinoplanes friuliensis DSM 7358 TaxID=1246995 RepID=U5W5L3_9ACTN|nr:LysR substrate-binding domain-containing protein [Actinoplanes friuliensis]AGZ44297.1 LysR family transcriptional regulator [Actinoplanes friuliensis DSM 7358]